MNGECSKNNFPLDTDNLYQIAAFVKQEQGEGII